MMEKNTFKYQDNRSIVLVGMMGVGKTSIGKLLSSETILPFYDSDNEVELLLDLSISDIFKKYGENYFREKEGEIFESLINKAQSVIASGGGAFINQKTQEKIRRHHQCHLHPRQGKPDAGKTVQRPGRARAGIF